MPRFLRLLAPLLVLSILGMAVFACTDDIAQVAEEPARQSTTDSATTRQAVSAEQSDTEVQQSDEATQQSSMQAESEEQAQAVEIQEEEAQAQEEAAQEEEQAEESGERSDTGTNIQVSGVDEPDVIKTDGEHFYVLDSDRLSVIAIDDDGLELRSTLWFDTPGMLHILGEQQLLLAGDTLLALRTVNIDIVEWSSRWHTQSRWMFYEWWGTWRWEALALGPDRHLNRNLTQLVEIDISDPGQPWIRRILDLDGDLLGARLVDGSARILLRSIPDQLDPGATSPNYALYEYESAAAYETRDRIVLTGQPLLDPDDTFTSGRTVVFADALVTLLTFDLSEGGARLGQWGAVAVPAEGAETTVYASVNSLYVAQRDSYYGPTDIHRFDLSDAMSPTFAGSAEAPGRLINQFALSEYRGHLRVATTLEDVSPTRSEIWIYEVSQSGMQHVSTLTNLGITELIYAVRFMGDRAFVVTFRQIDPLYITDLSDPREPFVAGELKLPGFSRYMHPLSGGRLLAVGQDADPSTGWPLGLQLSLFDVSDSYNPRLLDQLKPAPERRGLAVGWPEVDHRAFTYDEGIAYVPSLLLDDYDYGGVGRVFAVGVNCDELSMLGAFGGELDSFPVRVIPFNELLYVLSWNQDGFLFQRIARPDVPTDQSEFRERDRIHVSGGEAEYERLSGCD